MTSRRDSPVIDIAVSARQRLFYRYIISFKINIINTAGVNFIKIYNFFIFFKAFLTHMTKKRDR